MKAEGARGSGKRTCLLMFKVEHRGGRGRNENLFFEKRGNDGGGGGGKREKKKLLLRRPWVF